MTQPKEYENRDYVGLCKKVLGTDEGQELLRCLEYLYCDVDICSPDPHNRDVLAAKHDLVRELRRNLTSKKIEDNIESDFDV